MLQVQKVDAVRFCFVYRLMHKKALHLFSIESVSPIFSFSTDFWKDRFEIKEKMELEWKSGICVSCFEFLELIQKFGFRRLFRFQRWSCWPWPSSGCRCWLAGPRRTEDSSRSPTFTWWVDLTHLWSNKQSPETNDSKEPPLVKSLYEKPWMKVKFWMKFQA